MRRLIRSTRDAVFEVCYRLLMAGTSAGGPVRTPYGREELKRVHLALRSQRLFRWNGKLVAAFEGAFADLYEVPRAAASTSGTAALHVALGALDIREGDEIITTPITDMGTIVPILCQGATPVFADIDEGFNLSPASIEQRISKRTRAILVVHLFGNPCDMDAIRSIADRHRLPIVEDCAQALLASYKGRLLGTIGDMGCFSFQESKHLTTGDGGMTITRHAEYGERMTLFADKGFDRGSTDPVVYRFQAPNYRMNELTAAVGLAQLEKVAAVVRRRHRIGSRLTERLSGVSGIRPAPVTPGGYHVYWAYPLYLEGMDVAAFLETLRANRIPAGDHLARPVYLKAASLQSGRFAAHAARGPCPTAEALHRHLAVLWINENWGEAQIRHVADTIATIVDDGVRN